MVRTRGGRRAGPTDTPAASLQIPEHDDGDCLDDLEATGFVEVMSLANGLVRMTPAGIEVTAALRKHKAEGGQFAFAPQGIS